MKLPSTKMWKTGIWWGDQELSLKLIRHPSGYARVPASSACLWQRRHFLGIQSPIFASPTQLHTVFPLLLPNMNHGAFLPSSHLFLPLRLPWCFSSFLECYLNSILPVWIQITCQFLFIHLMNINSEPDTAWAEDQYGSLYLLPLRRLFLHPHCSPLISTAGWALAAWSPPSGLYSYTALTVIWHLEWTFCSLMEIPPVCIELLVHVQWLLVELRSWLWFIFLVRASICGCTSKPSPSFPHLSESLPN